VSGGGEAGAEECEGLAFGESLHIRVVTSGGFGRSAAPLVSGSLAQGEAPPAEAFPDHDEYFEWCEEHLDAFRGLERLAWAEDEFFYPKTDFQIQWEAEGKRLQGLRARKPV